MDKLDIAIIREMVVEASSLTLQPNIKQSYRLLARKLGVTKDTVRNRLRRLEAGFLTGWRVGINPSLLGYSGSFVFFDVRPPSLKPRVLEEVRRLPGMLWFADCTEGFIGCALAYKDADSLKSTLQKISRMSNAETLVGGSGRLPTCNLRLSKIDWSIVQDVQREPRRPYSETAKTLGVSTRTVRRRLDRMIEEHALFLMPSMNMEELQGSIAVNLTISYTSPEFKRDVDGKVISEFWDYLALAHLNSTEHGWYVLILPNLPKVEEVRKLATVLPGARNVLVNPIVDFVNVLGETFRDDLERILTRPRVLAGPAQSGRVAR